MITHVHIDIWRLLKLCFAGCGLVLLVMSGGCQEDPPEPEPPDDSFVYDVEIGNSEIPYIHIDTRFNMILNEPKVPADLNVYINKEEMLSTGIGIEYRGSTSFRISDKKSFGIETWDAGGADIDVPFFDFPAEEDWILMGHIVNLDGAYFNDKTLMYHYLGYELSRRMGRYASRSKYIELQINDTYQGVYVFMEKLKRDANRIDIAALGPLDEDPDAITGGYILKIDKTAGGDHTITQPLEYFEHNWEDDARYTRDISFRSQYDIFGDTLDLEPYGAPYHPEQYLETYFLYEYPRHEVITDRQKEYIRDYMHAFETALLADDFSAPGRTYTEYIDMSSFVDYFLINELCRNVDGYRLSTYLHKDRGGKLKMGPIWDLNIGYDTGDRIPWDDWVIHYNEHVSFDAWMMPFWWPRLLEDPMFRQAVKERWTVLRAGVLNTSAIMALVDETANHLIDNGAIGRNYTRWQTGPVVDYPGAIASLKNFLEVRADWMDGEIGGF